LMLSANSGLNPVQLRLGIMRTSRAFPSSGAGAGVAACRPPDTNEQDECYCSSTTCGAGMLDAAGATSAANSLKAWVTSASTEMQVGNSLLLDGAASWAVPPHAIATRTWSIVSGDGMATLQPATDQRLATVIGTNPGTVVVRLTITDDQGTSAHADTALSVVAAPSSGGGTMSWPWLLGLLVAVAALRPRRR